MVEQERAGAFLAFAGAFGGGILLLEAYRALSSGVWVEEPPEPEPDMNAGQAGGTFVALNVGVLLLAEGAKAISKEYGPKNVLLGSLGAAGAVLLLRAIVAR